MSPFAPRPDQLKTAPRVFTLVIPALCLAYLSVMTALGGPHPEHWLAAGIALLLALWSDHTRQLARVGLPFVLYAVIYDSMRWYEDYIRSPVIHVHEPYDFDLRFFAIGGSTPNEWLQRHTVPFLDFICGLAYTPFFFIGESVLLSLWLVWRGQAPRGQRFVWVFFVANLIGFSCYYIYPAAPPWYVTDHGFTVDLSVRASAAGALRFDQLVGMPIMRDFYGHSADVFGAIPSLHVVYPFLSLVYGWPLRRFRLWAIPYFFLVCFSAVYLNHHYVLDLFLGLGIASAVAVAARALFGPLAMSPVRELPVPASLGSREAA